MTPMYAACTTQMVPNTSDLVFIEFVANDMYRSGGVHTDCNRQAAGLMSYGCTPRRWSTCSWSISVLPCGLHSDCVRVLQ